MKESIDVRKRVREMRRGDALSGLWASRRRWGKKEEVKQKNASIYRYHNLKDTGLAQCCLSHLSGLSGAAERRLHLLLLLLVELDEPLRPQGWASQGLAEDGVHRGGLEPAGRHQFSKYEASQSFKHQLDRPTCIWGANRAAGSTPPPRTRRWWPRPLTGSRAWPPGGRRTARTWSGPGSASAHRASHCPSPLRSREWADPRCSWWAPGHQQEEEGDLVCENWQQLYDSWWVEKFDFIYFCFFFWLHIFCLFWFIWKKQFLTLRINKNSTLYSENIYENVTDLCLWPGSSAPYSPRSTPEH